MKATELAWAFKKCHLKGHTWKNPENKTIASSDPAISHSFLSEKWSNKNKRQIRDLSRISLRSELDHEKSCNLNFRFGESSLIASANGCPICYWVKDGGNNTADWKMSSLWSMEVRQEGWHHRLSQWKQISRAQKKVAKAQKPLTNMRIGWFSPTEERGPSKY